MKKRSDTIHSINSLFIAAITLAGCTSSPINTGQSPQVRNVKQSAIPSIQSPQLRIINQGSTALKKFFVLFPKDEVVFGDIPAEATTAYKSVPQGVYKYAAYSFIVNGKKVIVPFKDFVSEDPMIGNDFTYTVKFAHKQGGTVELVKVTKDK